MKIHFCGVFILATAISLSACAPTVPDSASSDGQSTTTRAVDPNPAPAPPSKADLLVLSMNNRAGICENKNRCVRGTEAEQFPSWTIHALYLMEGGKIPKNCSTTQKYNVTETLKPKLDHNWPSFTEEEAEGLWKREFLVHGSCVINSAFSNITNATIYFEAALQLNDRHNVSKLLSEILPSNDSPSNRSEIADKLNAGFPKKVQLSCGGQKDFNGSKVDILQEIRLCFDKTWNPEDCPDLQSCNTTEIWYLKNGASLPSMSVVLLVLLSVVAMLQRSF